MKNLLTYLTLILIVFSVATEAQEKTRKFNFKDFSAVNAGWGMRVKIPQSETYNIEVKANERDLKYLKVEKDGNELKFYIDKNFYRKQDDIYIAITMPALTELQLTGGSVCNLNMNNASRDFEASLSGGSGLKGKLECGDTELELSGGSEVTLSGSGKNLRIGGSGGSEFHLKDFNVKNVDCDLSGGSESQVRMNGRLNTSQSGGSELVYYGNAMMGEMDFSGGSEARSGD